MIEIKTKPIRDCDVSVPGSKSYSHRVLIASGLSDGICTIHNCLDSEDIRLTIGALNQMGVCIASDGEGFVVHGVRGNLSPCNSPIDLRNSGTSMRLLTALAAIGSGVYLLTGTSRMQERPIQDLLDGLKQLGVSVRSIRENGCPPVEITGDLIEGGRVTLNCSQSSQFLSALLLIAPYTQTGLDITVVQGPVSRPYIDMTVDVMERFGVVVQREGYERFKVHGLQCYHSGTYAVEPDCSQAGYFWGAAAITGAEIKVRGISENSRQGDVRFTEVLGKMGCQVLRASDGITVKGAALKAIEVDMKDMPDLVPTLAVVAAFASGSTIIKNVAHLRGKESDRLAAVANELRRMGVDAECGEETLVVRGGGKAHGAQIETYKDHRMAMSFALAGLRVPGIHIRNQQCVEKSFPAYWRVFEELYQT
jgi:3-phosphoshikimate 1-carboxyvinyltransferase